LPRYAKCIIAVSVDVSLCILTAWLALYLCLGEFVSLSGTLLWAAAISVAFSLPAFVVSGLYRAIFHYSGFLTIFAVARAIGVYGLLYASIFTDICIPCIPRTVGLIQPLLLFFAIGSSRALARYWLGGIYHSQLQVAALPKALVYGAGSVGRQLVSALDNSYEMRVVVFLDDDCLHGHVLNGQSIFSPDDLSELIESKGVTHVLLAIPSVSRRHRNKILKKIGHYHVAVRTLPSLTDFAEGRVTISDLRDLY
jgi:FlaA1/EpsC-like NDP-sugar epimerase